MTKVCRICLNETFNTHYINISSKLNEDKIILDCIIEFSSIQILYEDPLPQSICNQCFLQLDEFYIFRNLIVTSDKRLKDKFMNKPKVLIKKEFNVETGIVSHNNKSVEKLISKDQKAITYASQDFFENEDSQSNKSVEIIKSDLESGLINDQTDFKHFNLNDNVQEDINNLHNRRSHVAKKRLCKQKHNTIEERTVEIKKSNKFKELKVHECKECQKVFKKADHLNVHISYKHSEKQFKCEICNKKFARKYDLAYHKRVHTGERPFTCEICGKSFASSSYLYTHKRIHAGLKKIKCEMCQNAFSNSDQLQIHIRQKHTGEKPYLCEMCSHAFTSSSALFRHKRDVHDQKIKCPICNKLYSNRVLKEHIKRHKEKEEGIKRFICDLCGKRFTCATSRKRHLVTHSGEKAFKCKVCEKSFNQSSTLQTHMRIHSMVMQYHCEICTKSFRYKHHLKIHCEKNHKTEDHSSDNTQQYENILIKTE